ncbi:MAG: NusG domain II-containing protein [Spirochaetales bacterium]|nr:NusG domain II-containing protein [Spirochaetales bacterium]
MIKPVDIGLILLGILLVILSFILISRGGDPSLVRIDWGDKTLVYPLDEEETLLFENELGRNVVYINGEGSVTIIEADCEDQLCMTMGPITRTGQYMACLPHRLFVTITGEEDELVDTESW